jgi:hypothetical protein
MTPLGTAYLDNAGGLNDKGPPTNEISRSGDRISTIQLAKETMDRIITCSSGGSTINFKLCYLGSNLFCDGSRGHQKVPWVRIKNQEGQILYSDCPLENIFNVTFNIPQECCPPDFTPLPYVTETPLPYTTPTIELNYCNGEQISCYHEVFQGWGGSKAWRDSSCPNNCGCVPNDTLPDPYSITYPGNLQSIESWTGDTGSDGRPIVYGSCSS